jgi:hypothetical protein
MSVRWTRQMRRGARTVSGVRTGWRRRRPNRPLLLEALEGRLLLASSLTVGPVVNVSRALGSQSETTVAINPTDPRNIVVASNDNTRPAGLFYGVSFDGGQTFTSQTIAGGGDGLPLACCDPSAAFDSFGNLFIVYLDDTLSSSTVLLSTDGGQTLTRLASIANTSDQPKLRTGPGGAVAPGSIWVEYQDSAASISAVGAPVNGLGLVGAFSSPQTAPGSLGANFGKPDIGPNGQLLITYESPSGGEGSASLFAHLDADGLGPAAFGRAVLISGTNEGGFDLIPAQPTRSADAEIEVRYDNSNGPHRGRVYAIYTDEVPFDESNDNEIFVRYSDDDGQNWSPRIRVNDDPGTNSQFFSRIAVDPTSGVVAASWYDARLDAGTGVGDTDGRPNTDAIVFASISFDGGVTWEPNVQVGSGPSNSQSPGGDNNGGNEFGDYMGLDFYGDAFFPVWADNSTSLPSNPNRPTLDIATARVSVVRLTVAGATVTGSEDVPLTGRVASFTNSDPNVPLSDYSATIAWGDGTSSPADGIAVTITPNATGGFDVTGSHTYTEGGSYTTTVTVIQAGGGTSSATGQASIISAPLSATGGRAFAASEGTALSASLNPPSPGPVLVATFIDADPGPQNVDNYSVTIDWGDGTQSSGGTVAANGSGGYNVLADHTYTEGGSFIFRIFIREPGGNVATASGVARIASFPLFASGVGPLSLVEGTPFSGRVATFTDADPFPPIEPNYSATIDWGDGTSSPGLIAVTNVPGTFDVLGDHVFEFRAAPYPVHVTVREAGGNVFTTGDTDQNGVETPITLVTVVDAPISASGVSFTATEGEPFNGAVATFIDANAQGRPDQFRAAVDWGDGTSSDTASPDVAIVAVSPGEFRVIGRHVYAAATPVPRGVTVVIAGIGPGGSTASASSLATVADAPLSARGAPVIGQAGTFSGVVATFTDANPLGRAGQFAATIDWGDGTSSAGTITPTGPDGSGPFRVSGVHRYRAGIFPVLVTIRSVDGSTTTARSTAAIADVPVTAQGRAITATETLPTGPLVVATFADADPTSTVAEFTAVIDWGDGTTSAGTVAVNPAGGFAVLGDHTYSGPGTFPVGVTIRDAAGGGTVASAAGTATVAVRIVPLTGRLAAPSDSGSSDSDGVTRVTQPSFLGTAAPGSTVTLLARRSDQAAAVPIGTATVDASGTWGVTVGPLADGIYAVSATSANGAGLPNSPSTELSPLVIDTAGPVIAGITLDARRGRVLINFRDDVSRLDPQGLRTGSNFTLAGTNRRGQVLAGQRATAVTALDAQTVAVSFNNGRRLRSGTYVLTVAAQGLVDLAGNALDERSLVAFPQINVRPGGDLVAVIDTNGFQSSAPRAFIPGAVLEAAAAFRRFIRDRVRRSR